MITYYKLRTIFLLLKPWPLLFKTFTPLYPPFPRLMISFMNGPFKDEQDEELSNDMVNYGNDPFGHTNAEYAMMGRGETNEDRHRESIRTTGTSIGIMDNPRSTNAFSQTRHSSASNEALN